MPSELERRIQRGDKESIEAVFAEITLSHWGVDLPKEKKVAHITFLDQVRNYILEEVKG